MKDYTHDRGLHKIVDGVAIRTPAARKRERHIAYKRAGIPEIMLDVTLKDLKERSAWKREPQVVEAHKTPRVYWIQADAMSDRMLSTWVYVMRRYIDKGIEARCIKIQDIIDAQFDAGEKNHLNRELRELPLLVVDLTNSNTHKFIPTLLGDLHAARTRMKGTTIYLSDEDIGEMTGKYGVTLAGIFEKRRGMTRIASRNSGKP